MSEEAYGRRQQERSQDQLSSSPNTPAYGQHGVPSLQPISSGATAQTGTMSQTLPPISQLFDVINNPSSPPTASSSVTPSLSTFKRPSLDEGPQYYEGSPSKRQRPPSISPPGEQLGAVENASKFHCLSRNERPWKRSRTSLHPTSPRPSSHLTVATGMLKPLEPSQFKDEKSRPPPLQPIRAAPQPSAMPPIRPGEQYSARDPGRGLPTRTAAPWPEPAPLSSISNYASRSDLERDPRGGHGETTAPSSWSSTSPSSARAPDRNAASAGMHDPSYQVAWAVSDSGDPNFQRKRRGNLPKEATNLFKAWFRDHIRSPYPTEEEKIRFCEETGLSMNQVGNWFINARRRHPDRREARERGGSEDEGGRS